jgi:CDGSH-type Zn-finger protein
MVILSLLRIFTVYCERFDYTGSRKMTNVVELILFSFVLKEYKKRQNMEAKSKKKIKVLPNGPYEVTGSVPLNQLRFVPNQKGASVSYEEILKYPVQETYHLCRCGKSKNKPFCDGEHITTNFEGTETASHKPYKDLADIIEGELVDLMDAESYCAVARFCDTYTSTWNLINNIEPKAQEIVIQQCNDCPSGRLTILTKNGRKIEPDLPQEISILEDEIAKVHGPIWVKGCIPIEDGNGQLYAIRNRVTLCRCGKSRNKPFCDAIHMQNKKEESEK